jgi:hypothetical protein
MSIEERIDQLEKRVAQFEQQTTFRILLLALGVLAAVMMAGFL